MDESLKAWLKAIEKAAPKIARPLVMHPNQFIVRTSEDYIDDLIGGLMSGSIVISWGLIEPPKEGEMTLKECAKKAGSFPILVTRSSWRDPDCVLLLDGNFIELDNVGSCSRGGNNWTCLKNTTNWQLLDWFEQSSHQQRFEAKDSGLLPEFVPGVEYPSVAIENRTDCSDCSIGTGVCTCDLHTVLLRSGCQCGGS